VARIRQLIAEGVGPGEIAILYRINARSISYELELREAGVPYQVAKGGFLERRAAKNMIRRLGRGEYVVDVGDRVERLARDAGYVGHVDEDDVGPDEYTRQIDLHLLVELARKFDDGARTAGEFIEHLHDAFGAYEDAATRNAVRLSSLHLAKGLEWDAVFLPSVAERELPYWRAIEEGTVDEERRLFYVGLTRARRFLEVSYAAPQHRSSFLDEIEPPSAAPLTRVQRRASPGGGQRTTAAASRIASRSAPQSFSTLTADEVTSLLAALRSPWGTGGNGVRMQNHRSSAAWTHDEDRLLAHFQLRGISDGDIGVILGRRPEAIRLRLRKLQLI
jgi:DNA helicase-2/ATP-dependent DNA helicase PcrA